MYTLPRSQLSVLQAAEDDSDVEVMGSEQRFREQFGVSSCLRKLTVAEAHFRSEGSNARRQVEASAPSWLLAASAPGLKYKQQKHLLSFFLQLGTW